MKRNLDAPIREWFGGSRSRRRAGLHKPGCGHAARSTKLQPLHLNQTLATMNAMLIAITEGHRCVPFCRNPAASPRRGRCRPSVGICRAKRRQAGSVRGRVAQRTGGRGSETCGSPVGMPRENVAATSLRHDPGRWEKPLGNPTNSCLAALGAETNSIQIERKALIPSGSASKPASWAAGPRGREITPPLPRCRLPLGPPRHLSACRVRLG